MKPGWILAMGVAGGLLGAGLLLVVAGSPRGQSIYLTPPPSPSPMVVHITGAVVNPGVYYLARGQRVIDAIQAAGGFAPEADRSAINLATTLQDGERVWIPFKMGSIGSSETGYVTGIPSGDPWNQTQLTGLVNINSATQTELEQLPGIGPVMARRIIAYRQANGPFLRIEDIQQVTGIGPAIYEKIKPLITVTDQP